MRIVDIRAIAGPNVYSHRPVLVALLDLGELAGRESREFPGFNERLVAAVPGLCDHHCSLGRAGGFLERLTDGTYFGHILEHVALELSVSAGIPARHGKTRVTDDPQVYRLIVEYRSEAGMRRLMAIAAELVDALLAGRDYPLEAMLADTRKTIARTELGPSSRAIVEAAERRGIPWRRLNDQSLVQLGYGRNRRLIQAATTQNTSSISAELAGDKARTKVLLDQAGIRTPRGKTVRTADELRDAFSELSPPIVVKPLDGNQGRGVTTGIGSLAEAQAALAAAQAISPSVLVEEMLEGNDYRILVVGGLVVAASLRTPASVTGDGEHTIRELVDRVNVDPRRGDGHESPLTRIRLEGAPEATLARQGLLPDSVPERGRRVLLSEGANLSTGGEARDVTALVHPQIRSMCERAARLIGLDIAGIDLIAADISQPLNDKGGIVEVNASPGLRMHVHPSEGEPRDAGDAIVESLYPRGQDARIPIFSITGTNGKTTVTRIIAHVLSENGYTTGVTTTDGIWIGGERVVSGDTTGPNSAWTVLADPAVDAAVLETARGGIVRRGLGYDWADVAVMTNIQLDHIGQDGIRSLEDLLHIKSIVAERVREGGTLVLNADDSLIASLPERLSGRLDRRHVVYFTLADAHALVQSHIKRGGTGFFVRDGWIIESRGLSERRIVNAAAVPLTLGGTAAYQTANLLAAVAACRAHSIRPGPIAKALRSFRNHAANPGRSNLYRLGNAFVLLDYGHNAGAFDAIAAAAASWRGRRTGVVGVPGDRDDATIMQAGRAAARAFDRLIIREDVDLRGRAPAEVSRLLMNAIEDEAPGKPCACVPDSCRAIQTACADARQDDLVVVFYEHLQPAQECIVRLGGVAVDTFEAAECKVRC
jgi:cyanophycin synthetase